MMENDGMFVASRIEIGLKGLRKLSSPSSFSVWLSVHRNVLHE